MADKGNIIIVKKKKGGHGGGHGGAWKVAFADFMTAMMAFFLVMWLLGSDEEVKSQVAHYFNNPTSAWRPDLASPETVPLGDRTASGDNLLSGQEGAMPDDLVDRPNREFKQNPYEKTDRDVPVTEVLGDKPPFKINYEYLKFSVAEHKVFASGTDAFKTSSIPFLKQLAHLAKGFGGKLMIRGYSQPKLSSQADSYSFALTRVVALKQFLVGKRVIDEKRVKTSVKSKREPASQAPSFTYEGRANSVRSRKIDFIFKGNST